MIILKVNENKVLSVNSTTGIYQSENNFDKFRVYVSPFISGHSVDTLTVNLNIVNPDEEMDIIELKLNKDTSNYFTQDLNLGVKYTSLPGQYRVYIKFINAEGVVGKTNCIHYVVEEIDEPADAISEKFITIIDQYNSRLIEIDQKIQEAGTVISVSNERSTPTSTIVFSDTGIMKIFDYNTFTSGGFFASNGCANAKYIFFPQTVTNIGSGVCAGLTKLEHVYIDNDANSKTLTVDSSAFSLSNGATATVHYKKDFHYGEFVARFLFNIGSRLNSLESNTSDLQNKIQDLEDDKADLVQSQNLFDVLAYLDLLASSTNPVTKGVLDNIDRSNNSFTITSSGDDCYTNKWTNADSPKFSIDVKPNTTYTLSWDCEGASGNVFVFSNATTTKIWKAANNKKLLTFTTDDDTTFVTVRFGVANANNTVTYNNIQIELGDVATEYTPCKVAQGIKELNRKVDKLQSSNSDKINSITDDITNLAIKNQTTKANSAVITDSSNYSILDLQTSNDDFNISLYGKNLLNPSVFIRKYHTNAYVAQGSMIVDSDSISYNMTEGNYCGVYFKYNEFITDSLLVDKPCVFSLIVTVDKSCTFRLFDETNSQYVTKTLKPNVETLISLNTTITQSAKALTMYGVNITETTHIKLSNMMLELGDSATEYEPYQDMQSVSNSTDLSNIHTYYPNTTVISDCDCQIAYVADTKNYTDHNLDTKENISNKIDTINFPSTTYYPSNKAVWDYVNSKLETPLSDIESLKSGKLDKTDFNTYKTATDKVVGDNTNNINLLDTNKADLVQSHNMFDWSKLLSAHTSAFTVDKNEDEGYRITGTTVNKYQQILTNQKLQLDDGDYYISDSAINNTDAIVYCQLALIDTDGKSTYYNNAKVTIDSSKYTSIYLSVQTGATVGEVDTVIYPMLCKYDDANIQYLPHRVSEGIPLIAGCIPNIKNNVSAKADNIVCSTDKASSCYLNDSSKNHIKGLSLYGNSIQSAVPTPTAPVTIDNVNNPTITLYKKNLFDMNRCTIHTNGKAILNSTDRVNSIINFTTNGNTVNSGVYMRHTDLNTPAGLDRGYGIDYTKLNGKSVTLSLDIQSDVDCRMRVQFTKYSYTDVDISSTKQRFSVTEVVDTSKLNKAFCFYLDNIEATVTISNIQIEVGSIATNYESRECNSLTIEKSLHGMGDVCDTLTVNSDGTGYITQRLFVERITSQKKSTSLEWNYSATTNRFFRNDYSYSFDVKDNKPLILCSHLDVGENEKNTAFDNSIGWINVSGVGIAIRMTEFDGDIAKFKKWLDDNEVYMVAPLAKPIRVDLSKVEVDKILSLYTYYPITTIIADCDFQLKYIADTKIYTDYKNDLLDEKIKQNSNDIQKKYDNSKIETGIGNIYYQGTNIIAKFNYTKIENMVTIQIAISNLPSDKNYLDCLGLPFIATIGQIYRWLAISSANNQYKLAVSGSHFYINKISGNFASDETITTTFSYLINS